MPWYVHILACRDNSCYVGHARNPRQRFARHVAGQGARHTATNPPEHIRHTETFATEREAVARERQLKRWSRAKKLALARGDLKELRRLSRSRD